MSKRFRVAFSFPAEKRPFISEVARILASRFGSDRIFYDKYHEAELARTNLDSHLSSIYRDQTDLVVVAISTGYDRKNWCGLEWAAIYSHLRSYHSGSVMLFRWNQVEGVGLYGVDGFIDLDARTPDDAANLILLRLALQEGHPDDYYAHSIPESEWPEVAPTLEWLVADLDEARRAFSQLITRNPPFRLLLVHGQSGTGKSVFTRQCMESALRIPALRCGRLDFKVVWQPVPSLAQALEIPVNTGGTVSTQLGEILRGLTAAPRPTLLILDTFELAGEAERWVRDSLLPATIRLPWLRLVITGQQTPDSVGEAWEPISAQIELVAPSAHQWFEYGSQHKRGLTLEFVQQAYELSGGNSVLLAQLLSSTELP